MSKLLKRVKAEIKRRNYSYRTEKCYCGWIVRFVRYHNFTHPNNLGEKEIVEYLNYLANERRVAASTQNQALSALVFLYEHILKSPLGHLENLKRAKKPKRLPVVLTEQEAVRILRQIYGVERLVLGLIYGSGLRISESLRIRIGDLDFQYNQITVRTGKGLQDRITMLPTSLTTDLKRHIRKVEKLHQQDIQKGFGRTILPNALSVKYPNADREFHWQFLFPSSKRSYHRTKEIWHRYHISPKKIRTELNRVVRKVGVQKQVSPHTFRHSFATHLLNCGYDIRTVQELLGHKSVKTTMIYTHVLNKGGKGVVSPVDQNSVFE